METAGAVKSEKIQPAISRERLVRFSEKFQGAYPSARARGRHHPQPPTPIRGGARGPQIFGVTPQNHPLPVQLAPNFQYQKLGAEGPIKYWGPIPG